MDFEQLASRAGKAAATVGKNAERPSFSRVLHIHRRRDRLAAWAGVTLVLAIVIGIVAWSGTGPEGPLAAASTTTTTTIPATTTTATISTTTSTSAIEQDQCPVTFPGQEPFTPVTDAPEPPAENYQSSWYGTRSLWTLLLNEGEVWEPLPTAPDGTLTQQTFWWSDSYTNSTVTPDITVTLENINGEGAPVTMTDQGGGGNAEWGVFMIVLLHIPSDGCWRITAEYEGATVSYVAWASGQPTDG